jgi:hypothetical protein
MKVTYHIPTEKFGFVEVVQELPPETEQYSYWEHKNRTLGGEGVSEIEFNKILDRYMEKKGVGAMSSDEYESLNLAQQSIIQCLKRAYKRKQNGN